jgi:hypothetical protein
MGGGMFRLEEVVGGMGRRNVRVEGVWGGGMGRTKSFRVEGVGGGGNLKMGKGGIRRPP